MAIHFEVNPDGDLLRVRAWGQDESLQDAQNYAGAVLSACAEHGCFRVLCDERELMYGLDTMETFMLAEYEIATAAPPYVLQVAIVHPPQDHELDRFYENVMVNRGVGLRMFTRMEDARAWLGVEQDPV